MQVLFAKKMKKAKSKARKAGRNTSLKNQYVKIRAAPREPRLRLAHRLAGHYTRPACCRWGTAK
jgi:hypothetical protein